MVCSLKEKIVALISSGILTTTVGVVLYFIFPEMMNNEIKKRLIIKEGTESYKNWMNIPVPIYLHFYFFNVTNPEEVYSHSNKPVLNQLGPYTFSEKREKIVSSVNNNKTITYRQIKRWYYEPSRTEGSLNDMVTTLNLPMVAAAAKAKQINKMLVYFTMEEMFDLFNSSWFVQKPVRELLFEGYLDPLMEIAEKFGGVPYDKFGWFYKKNGTDDGEVIIYTGEDDINLLDKIQSWDGKKTVPSFLSPCNMINGTAGDMWAPSLTKISKLTFFVPDMCRSISFAFQKEMYASGVRTYRYWSDKTQLDNGAYDPSNRCFCGESVCLPPGAINVSSCKYDAPVLVSYPHFLFADPIYNEGVLGLNPDPEKHQMFLDIVPEMGIPVRVAARMQINIIFEAIPEIRQFRNISERIYFPLLWFSETAEAGKDVSEQLKLVLITIPTVAKVFSLLCILVGIVLAMSTAILFRPFKWKNQAFYSAVDTT